MEYFILVSYHSWFLQSISPISYSRMTINNKKCMFFCSRHTNSQAMNTSWSERKQHPRREMWRERSLALLPRQERRRVYFQMIWQPTHVSRPTSLPKALVNKEVLASWSCGEIAAVSIKKHLKFVSIKARVMTMTLHCFISNTAIMSVFSLVCLSGRVRSSTLCSLFNIHSWCFLSYLIKFCIL